MPDGRWTGKGRRRLRRQSRFRYCDIRPRVPHDKVDSPSLEVAEFLGEHLAGVQAQTVDDQLRQFRVRCAAEHFDVGHRCCWSLSGVCRRCTRYRGVCGYRGIVRATITYYLRGRGWFRVATLARTDRQSEAIRTVRVSILAAGTNCEFLANFFRFSSRLRDVIFPQDCGVCAGELGLLEDDNNMRTVEYNRYGYALW